MPANHPDMSKHSKWSKVKHQKAVADVKKAAVFTKLARAITVAAREGGGDPAFNFKLRTAIDLALAANMPKDNVERAVKKGTGEAASDRIEEVVYEGYGPGGVAVVVEALTDNRNRTSSNLKHVFSSHGGNLAGSGAVQWMFDRRAVVRAKAEGPLGEEAELALIDAGAEDLAVEDGEAVIVGQPDALARLRDKAESLGLAVTGAGFERVAKEPVAVADPGTREGLEALFEALDDDEDVGSIYSNLA
jgi:YebC/PmpR family DNA-binding regulatory protein